MAAFGAMAVVVGLGMEYVGVGPVVCCGGDDDDLERGVSLVVVVGPLVIVESPFVYIRVSGCPLSWSSSSSGRRLPLAVKLARVPCICRSCSLI